ncbi:MAG: DMT family transporter [Thiobacillaceae bacterium]
MTSRLLPVLGLLFGASMWGLIWYPYRLLESAGVGGVVSSLASYAVPFLLAFPFLWRHVLSARANLGWLALLALAAGWTNMGYVLAVIGGEIMRVLLLFYLAPVWTVILARWLLHEKLSRGGWAIMALSLTGALTMLWPKGSGLPLPANHAEWIALSAGATFALSNVVTRKVEGADTWAKSLAIWAGVAAVALISLGYEARPFAFAVTASLSTWLILAGVGLALGVMTLSVQYGLSHTPANQAIVIFLFELVVAAMSSWFLAHESLTAHEWTGAAMIIAGSLFSGRMEPQPAEAAP